MELVRHPYVIKVLVDENGTVIPQDPETFCVPIGALCLLMVEVYRNGNKIKVGSSIWTVGGDGSFVTVAQTNKKGTFTTTQQDHPAKFYGGPDPYDPDESNSPNAIKTGWSTPGLKQIDIIGKFILPENRLAMYEFNARAFVNVIAPNITVNVTDPHIQKDLCTFDGDADAVYAHFKTCDVFMTEVPEMLAGGIGGFFQVIRGVHLRGEWDKNSKKRHP